MRKAPTVLLLSLAVPALSALPVISAPAATPHPVAPDVRSAALAGVDPTVLSSPAGVRSASVARQAWRDSASPTSRTTFGPSASGPAVLAGARQVKTFQLLGVTWRASVHPADLTVVVRAHGGQGWSAWTPLEAQDATDAEQQVSGRMGTEPLWVGDSDGYQVRIDLNSGNLPSGLRVDLVAPGDSPADATAGQDRSPAAKAAAAVSAPVINSRASWGADEKIRNGGPYYNATIKEGFVHHTAGTNGYSSATVPKIIRGIYAYHVKANGWSDIGYNFLVDRFGRLWEGRYGGITRAVRGAHTGGFNVDSFAVSAIGNYETAAAPAVMVDAIARLLAWKLSLYYRNPMGTTTLVSQGGGTSKYPAGRSVTFNVISGHRDAGNTDCPGTNLYKQLGNIRTLTESYLGPALINPATSSDQVAAGTSLTVAAKTTQAQQWRLDVRNHIDGTLVRTLTGSAAPGEPVSAVWDQRDSAGAVSRPGAYDLGLSSSTSTGTARTWNHRVAVLPPPGQPATAPPATLPGTSGFVPLDPTRVYDSLTGGHLPLGPAQRLDVRVLGAGGVPSSGVGSVALTITASWPTSTTSLKIWPAGASRPSSSTMTVESGTTRSALAISAVGGKGLVSLWNSAGVTEVAVDVVGYYPTAGGQRLHMLRPYRLYDSRAKDGMIRDGTGRSVTLRSRHGIAPSRMGAAIVNVTALSGSGTGDVIVHSPGSGLTDAVTLTFSKATKVSSRTITALTAGAMRISVRGADTQVVVDVIGWYASSAVPGGKRFQATSPHRVLDTNAGVGASRASVRRDGTLVVKVAGKGRVLPKTARAVLLDLTSSSMKMLTYRVAWSVHPTWPSSSDIYLTKGRATSHLVLVRVRHGGKKKGRINLRNYAKKTNLVADIVGYYR